MNSRQESITFHRNYCVHYKPDPGKIGCDSCALKLDSQRRMREARAQNEPNMTPCIGGHKTPNVLTLCQSWERRSLESAEQYADNIERAMNRMTVVMPVIAKWRTWTDKNRVAKQEIIECPSCKGRLYLSQSSYNGHVRGRCETENCVSWIE